jgi:hypothetical protein
MARVTLKIRAGAKRTAFCGKLGDAWKLQVAAPPVDGKANEALRRFLAELTACPFSGVRIIAGQTSPRKIVEIDGIDAQALNRAILKSQDFTQHGSEPNTGIA